MSDLDMGPSGMRLDSGYKAPQPQPQQPPRKKESPKLMNANEAIRFIKSRGELLSAHEAQFKTNGAGIEALDLHDLPGLTAQDLAVLARTCPNLKSLNIKNCSGVTGEALVELVKFKALKVLDFQGSSLGVVTAANASAALQEMLSKDTSSIPVLGILHTQRHVLTRVDLHDLTITPQHLTALAKIFTDLRTLHLKNCHLTNASMKEVAKFTKLEDLDITGNQDVTGAALVDLIQLKALKTLQLKDAAALKESEVDVGAIVRELVTHKTLSSALVQKLKEMGPSVTQIDLNGLSITQTELRALTQLFPNLRMLNLKNCGLTDAHMTELARCRHLENLDVSLNKALTGASLASLAPLTKLKSVNLEGCTALTTFGNALQTFDTAVQKNVKKLLESKEKTTPPTPLTAEEKTLLNIIKRCEQIPKAQIEKQPLSPQDILRVAYFVEVRLPGEVKKGISIFTKKAYNLPRSLQYSQEAGGTAYLIAQHNISKVQGQSGFKKVTSAAQLRLNEYSQTPAHYIRGLTLSRLTKAEFEQSMQEVTLTRKIAQGIQERFPDMPLGIVPVHTVRDFTNLQRVQKLSFISPAFNGDYIHFMDRPEPLSHETFIQLTKGAALGLYQMHSIGYAHADFKNDNCVYKENPVTRQIEAGVIDFGFAFRPKTEAPKSDTGYYATPIFTSPEQFGVIPFRGDFMKADVFALGVTLYRQLYKTDPPWVKYILHHAEHGRPEELQARQTQVGKSLQESVEEPLKALLQKATLSADEQLLCLIYQTMRQNPAKRIDMATFMAELAKIGNFAWPPVSAASPPPVQKPVSPAVPSTVQMRAPAAPPTQKPAPLPQRAPPPPQAAAANVAAARPVVPSAVPKPVAAQPPSLAAEMVLQKKLRKELEFIVSTSEEGYEIVEKANCLEIYKLFQVVPASWLAAQIQKDALVEDGKEGVYNKAIARLARFDEKNGTNDSDFRELAQLLADVKKEVAQLEPKPKAAARKPAAQPKEPKARAQRFPTPPSIDIFHEGRRVSSSPRSPGSPPPGSPPNAPGGPRRAPQPPPPAFAGARREDINLPQEPPPTAQAKPRVPQPSPPAFAGARVEDINSPPEPPSAQAMPKAAPRTAQAPPPAFAGARRENMNAPQPSPAAAMPPPQPAVAEPQRQQAAKKRTPGEILNAVMEISNYKSSKYAKAFRAFAQLYEENIGKHLKKNKTTGEVESFGNFIDRMKGLHKDVVDDFLKKFIAAIQPMPNPEYPGKLLTRFLPLLLHPDKINMHVKDDGEATAYLKQLNDFRVFFVAKLGTPLPKSRKK